MTATAHAIIGTLIAAKFHNPALGIPLSILSHMAADAFPHWDTATNYRQKSKARLWIDSGIDVLVGFGLSYILIQTLFPDTNVSYAFLLIILAQLLDWATIPYFFLGFHYPPFTWVYKLQKVFDARMDKPWGIINQVGVILLSIVVAKFS